MSRISFPRGEGVRRPAGLFSVPRPPLTGSTSRLNGFFRCACREERTWSTRRDRPAGSSRVPWLRGPAVVRRDFRSVPGPPPGWPPRLPAHPPGEAARPCPGSGEGTMRRRPGLHRSASRAAVLPRHHRQLDAPVGMPGSPCAHRRRSRVSGHRASSVRTGSRVIRNVTHPIRCRGVSGWWRGISGVLQSRSAPATGPVAARRETARVGRRFSGTPAKRS